MNAPETIDHLKVIRTAISELMPHTLENVLKNWVGRIGYIKLSRFEKEHFVFILTINLKIDPYWITFYVQEMEKYFE